MSYIKYGFTLTDSQKEAPRNAHQKHMGYTLRLPHSQLSGNDFLNINKTQYNKITKAKTDCRNIELKLSKSQIAKMVDQSVPSLVKYAPYH